VLVVGKNEPATKDLENKFEEGHVEKEYLALVIGHPYPKEGRIDFPLPGRDERAVPALTFYKVEREFAETALVRVKIATGRMHQIRLHFAKLGHPLVMDDEHGDFSFNKRFRKAYGLRRQFLHACSIAFEHRGKQRTWRASMPADLSSTLADLESHS
jgi:23S rRNA pseudouridine955/2504/2580 synthase